MKVKERWSKTTEQNVKRRSRIDVQGLFIKDDWSITNGQNNMVEYWWSETGGQGQKVKD